MKLEDLNPNSFVRGILPDALVTVVNVQWFGSDALEVTYVDAGGRVANTLLYRHDEPRLEIIAHGRPWRLYGDGSPNNRTVAIATLLAPPVGMLILRPLWPLFAFLAPVAALVSAATLMKALSGETPGSKLVFGLGIIAVCVFVEGFLCFIAVGAVGLPLSPSR